jgi:hypothetical protein
VDYERNFTNDNASPITVGQIGYIKSNGAVDLARADVAALVNEAELVVVVASSIAVAASGKCFVREGVIISGFSSLTPSQPVYVSRTTAGAVTQSLAGFVTGESVFQVGKAISATEVKYKPVFLYQL